MSKTVVVTTRIDADLSAKLDRLGDLRDRSRAWLVHKAIEHFVTRDLEFYENLREGEEAIERGDYLSHDEFMAELRERYGERKAAA